MKQQYDVFISYRRKGGDSTARLFYERLQAMGYRVSFDMETLRSGKFNEQLYRRIEECKDVLAVLSEGSLELRENPEDDWFRLELAHAIKCGKNIVPVFLRDFSFPKVGDLPPDIAELPNYEGVTASDEHFDSTLGRICHLLMARPRRIVRKTILGLVGVVLLLGVGVTGWVCRDSILPYPLTLRDKQRVGNLVGYVSLLATTYHDLMDAELELVTKARLAIEANDRSGYDQEVPLFVHKVDGLKRQLANSEKPLQKVLLDIESMPVDSAGFPLFVEGVRQDFGFVDDFLKTLGRWVNPKNTMRKSERLRLVEIKKEIIECEVRVFSYSVMGTFCNISEDALSDLKRIALQWKRMSDLARTWSRDEKEIERIGESLCNQMKSLADELATMTGNANVDLANERERFRNQLIEQGATPEKADRVMEGIGSHKDAGNPEEFLKSIGMPDLPTPKTPEELRENLKKLGASPEQIEAQVAKMEKVFELQRKLDEAKGGLEAVRERARKKFAPQTSDDDGLLWGKVLKFNALNMPEEAQKCIDMLKSRNSKQFPLEAIASGELFFAKAGELPFKGGLLVCHFEPPATSHAIFCVGDIITGVDDKVCRTFDDYRMKVGAVYTVQRFDGKGGFRECKLTMPEGQPRTALVDLAQE